MGPMRRRRRLFLHAAQASRAERRSSGHGCELAGRPAICPMAVGGDRQGVPSPDGEGVGFSGAGRRGAGGREALGRSAPRLGRGLCEFRDSREEDHGACRPLRREPPGHPRSGRQRVGVDRFVLARRRQPKAGTAHRRTAAGFGSWPASTAPGSPSSFGTYPSADARSAILPRTSAFGSCSTTTPRRRGTGSCRPCSGGCASRPSEFDSAPGARETRAARPSRRRSGAHPARARRDCRCIRHGDRAESALAFPAAARPRRSSNCPAS